MDIFRGGGGIRMGTTFCWHGVSFVPERATSPKLVPHSSVRTRFDSRPGHPAPHDLVARKGAERPSLASERLRKGREPSISQRSRSAMVFQRPGQEDEA